MCQFKSGIAVRINESEVTVRVLPLNDSHSDIRDKSQMNMDNLGLSRYSTPVELIPTKLDFDDKSYWKFVFDDRKSDWWTDGMTDQCIDQLLKAAKADFYALINGQKYDGTLDLDSLVCIPEGFNPNVAGSIRLNNLTSIPQGFSPTVGGSLYLDRLTSISEGFNPTVECSLYLSSLTGIPDSVRKSVKGQVFLKG